MSTEEKRKKILFNCNIYINGGLKFKNTILTHQKNIKSKNVENRITQKVIFIIESISKEKDLL